MSRNFYAILFLAVLSCGVCGVVWALPQEVPQGETVESSGGVQSELTFILAAKNPVEMDKRLAHMAKDLRRAFAGRYRSFKYNKSWTPSLKKGETKEFPLPGGGAMKISFRGSEGPYLRLHLNMPDWDGVVRVRNGKRFFHAGRKHGDGILIVGVKLSVASK